MKVIEFEVLAANSAVNYHNHYYCKDDKHKVSDENAHIVWMSKILNHNKATVIIIPNEQTKPDPVYYEVTYNGKKSVIYVDVYEKVNHGVGEIKNDGVYMAFGEPRESE